MSPIFSPAHGIGTEAGRYLRRVAFEDAPVRRGAPDADSRCVWEIAFGLAVLRRFEPDSPLAEIRRTVSTALRQHSAAAPPLEAEMLLREALGEDVPADEIGDAVRTGVHLVLFARLVDELALTDDELESLVAQAEELAADPGISPRPGLTDVP